jgi:hypothetical protein
MVDIKIHQENDLYYRTVNISLQVIQQLPRVKVPTGVI